ALEQRRLHVLFVEGAGENCPCQRSQRLSGVTHCLKNRLLVFLKFTPVTETQALLEHVECRYVADQAGALTSDQFRDIWVFFLRHHARACRELIRKAHEAEFRRAPNDEFFTDSAQVHTQDGQSRGNVHEKIPAPRGIKGISHRAVKPEFSSNAFPVERKTSASDSPSTER